jgi:hypothetical protein
MGNRPVAAPRNVVTVPDRPDDRDDPDGDDVNRSVAAPPERRHGACGTRRTYAQRQCEPPDHRSGERRHGTRCTRRTYAHRRFERSDRRTRNVVTVPGADSTNPARPDDADRSDRRPGERRYGARATGTRWTPRTPGHPTAAALWVRSSDRGARVSGSEGGRNHRRRGEYIRPITVHGRSRRRTSVASGGRRTHAHRRPGWALRQERRQALGSKSSPR